MKKIAIILLFTTIHLDAGFLSVVSLKQSIVQMRKQLRKARILLKKLPKKRIIIQSFQNRKPIRNFISHWDNNRLILIKPHILYAIYESPNNYVLSDKSFTFSITQNRKSKLYVLNANSGRWIGYYTISHRTPIAEEIKIQGTTISRSRKPGEFLLTVTDNKGYGYRLSINGILSFNALTTASLFHNPSWLRKRGHSLLKAAAIDIPNNIVSRILFSYKQKNGHQLRTRTLTQFTINFFRQKAGLPGIRSSNPLTSTASVHAKYISANHRAGRPGSIHNQYTDGFGYTGKTVRERVQQAGYKNDAIELIGYEGNPVSCIAAWMQTIHHRRSILSMNIRECGFGSATFPYSNDSDVGVLLLGISPKPIVQKKLFWLGINPVWPIWNGREKPAPKTTFLPPFGPALTFWCLKPGQLYWRNNLIQTVPFNFHKEKHLLPKKPLSWGKRYTIIRNQRILHFRTSRYPIALKILDQLH